MDPIRLEKNTAFKQYNYCNSREGQSDLKKQHKDCRPGKTRQPFYSKKGNGRYLKEHQELKDACGSPFVFGLRDPGG